VKHLKSFKLFESISSDRRAFSNWLDKLHPDLDKSDISYLSYLYRQHEDLFQLFLKYRGKLDNKDIFSYTSTYELERKLEDASKTTSVKNFEKDIRNWNKLNLNVDILFQDENYVILHSKDFESEKKLGSGCHLCTNSKIIYDGYLKNDVYLFDILDLKNNQRYFGTYTPTSTFQKAKTYTIVDRNDSRVSDRERTTNGWKVVYNLSDDLSIKHIENLCDQIIDSIFFKVESITESKSNDDTLYIFDFDDTIVDSPRFEELAINYLRENVTTKTLVNRALKQIGKKKEDIKIENGRLYINDPNSEIEVKGDWVRKKGRVYMVAPDKFYYLEESFPDKLTELSSLYKKVKNKAIVTARIKTVKKLVEKYLDKLELGQPNWGLFMFPLREETPDRVATWKAKTIIKLVQESGFKKVEFFDDKSKTVNAVSKAMKEKLPDVEFKGHKVKSPEMTYIKK